MFVIRFRRFSGWGLMVAITLASCDRPRVGAPTYQIAPDLPSLRFRFLEESKSIEITIDNPSKSEMILTTRIGFVHAIVKNGLKKSDHLIDDGFNMDLKLLEAKDLETIKPGSKLTFVRACRTKEFMAIKGTDEILVEIDPVSITSFIDEDQPKIRNLESKLLSASLRGGMTGFQPLPQLPVK